MTMDLGKRIQWRLFFISDFLLLLASLNLQVSFADQTNPFTARASLLRYWNKHISNDLPKPSFLLSKASPLTAVEAAFFTKLAAQKTLSSHLSAFCSAANLLCYISSQPQPENHSGDDQDSNFALYSNRKFSNYGNSRLGGSDQFKNYSDGFNFASDGFTQYSRNSGRHGEAFAAYSNDGNVADSNFTSYSSGATGGSGDFKSYLTRANVLNLRFTSYDSDGNGHPLSFTSYVDDTNSGDQTFISYGKKGNSLPVEFSSYGRESNTVGSKFAGYGELGNAANDSFRSYSGNANNPTNRFSNYGLGGNGGVDSFTSYRDSANAGTESFQAYGRNSNSVKTGFSNYGKSFNVGFDTFKEYGKGATDQTTGFKVYGLNSTFKEYAKQGTSVTFAQYASQKDSNFSTKNLKNGVEEGKFFREMILKEGTEFKMPNIRDWMPKRSFLPRVISSKLPFSSKGLLELELAFGVEGNSTMGRAMANALAECERSPSMGETKRCVGSIEDMIDFATLVLGKKVVVRTTENVNGSKQNVMIGKVRGMNDGSVTKSVSCHQSLFPYILYYCHSVPNVRLYEAEILEVKTKGLINHGVAICHLDTSGWSPNHGALVELGSSPGLIEVCHWIFENDMTWAKSD